MTGTGACQNPGSSRERMEACIILSPSKTLISSETYFSWHILSCMILGYASEKCPNSWLSWISPSTFILVCLCQQIRICEYNLCVCVPFCDMHRLLNRGQTSMTLKSKMTHNTVSIPTLRILSKRHMLLLGSRRNHWASVQYRTKTLVHTWTAWARNSQEPPQMMSLWLKQSQGRKLESHRFINNEVNGNSLDYNSIFLSPQRTASHDIISFIQLGKECSPFPL